jgi:hypothetical protein
MTTGRSNPSEPAAPATSGVPGRYVEVTEQKRLNDAREAGIPWK